MVSVLNFLKAKLGREWIFYIAAIALCLDILSKTAVRFFHPDYSLLPFFSISYITNTGAAFGMFQGSNIILMLVSLAVIVFILLFYKSIPCSFAYSVGIGLVLGGAVGNLIDRIFFGFVTDFIAFSFFPAFNIADSCITIGALILAAHIFFHDSKRKSNRA
jgi:signal peptidase II